MQQYALHGDLLVKLIGTYDSPSRLDAINVDSGASYSQPLEPGTDPKLLQGLIAPETTSRVVGNIVEGGLELKYSRVLPSGLELRPRQLVLADANPPLKLATLIAELCGDNAALRAGEAAYKKDAETRLILMQDMVKEKEAYQRTMLERMSVLIEDRNNRLAAIAVKEEPQ